MTGFRIGRLPAGPTQVSVNGVTRTVTVEPARAAAQATLVVQRSVPAGGFAKPTANLNPGETDYAMNGTSFPIPAQCEPVCWRWQINALSGSTATRAVSRYDEMAKFGAFHENLFVGAEVVVRRVVDHGGDVFSLTEVGSGTVTAARLRALNRVREVQPVLDADNKRPALSDTNLIPSSARSWKIAPPSWWRPGGAIWLCVVAVDAGGAVSPVSNAVATAIPTAFLSGLDAWNLNNPTPVTVSAGNALKLDQASATLTAPPQNVAVSTATANALTVSWDAPASGSPSAYHILWSEHDPASFSGMDESWVDVSGVSLEVGDFVDLRRVLYGANRDGVIGASYWTETNARNAFIPDARATHGASSPFVNGSPAPFVWGDERPADATAAYVKWSDHGQPPAGLAPFAGECFFAVTIQPGKSVSLGWLTWGGSQKHNIPPVIGGVEYRVEGWLLLPSGATASVNMGDTGGAFSATQTQAITPTGDWQFVSGAFTPTASAAGNVTGVSWFSVTNTSASPVTVGCKNLVMREAGDPPHAFLARDAARYAGKFGRVRYHHSVKTESRSYDLRRLLTGGMFKYAGPSLARFFAETKRIGATPWVQITGHFSAAELLGYVEWLAAPSGTSEITGWRDAQKAALGLSAGPWTDDFAAFRHELGNEWFIDLDKPWHTSKFRADSQYGDTRIKGLNGPQLQGLWITWVEQVMRSSPWWSALEGRMDFAISTWTSQATSSWTDSLLARWSSANRVLCVAPYIGGWEIGQTGRPLNSRGWFNFMVDGPLRAAANVARHVAAAGALGVSVEEYEQNIGFASPESASGNPLLWASSASGDVFRREEEIGAKSQAAAVGIAYAALTKAALGLRSQNWFMLGAGQRGVDRTTDGLGGVENPTFQTWLAVQDALVGADLFRVLASGPLPLVTTPGIPAGGIPGTADTPEVAVFAARRGSEWTVFVLNLALPYAALPSNDPGGMHDPADDGVRSVRLHLPFRTAASLTCRRMTGNYDDTIWKPLADNPAPLMVTEALAVPADCRVLDIGPALGGVTGGAPPASFIALTFAGVGA